MLKRLLLPAALAVGLALPAAAAPETSRRLDIGQIMGRWYEVARVPNQLQRGCQAGTSDWARNAGGFSVVQACLRGGSLVQWRAQAKQDPAQDGRVRMTFFGGLVSQDYRVLEHRPDQGWLVLATANGRYLWLMSQRPNLPESVRGQALARIRQLGFDVGRLEFPGGRT